MDVWSFDFVTPAASLQVSAEGGPGVVQTEHEDLNSVLEETDVLYVTRIQKERFASDEVGQGAASGVTCRYRRPRCNHRKQG